jgi:hypothetical protein
MLTSTAAQGFVELAELQGGERRPIGLDRHTVLFGS